MTESLTSPARGLQISSAEALDAAFGGQHCELVRADGTVRLVAAQRWFDTASASDLALFVDPCVGSTLDVGCGPGRLTAALNDRGVDVLGIDISGEAVRQTSQRGAPAIHRDVFEHVPGGDRWRHILLADGNIGLGGHPVRLLRRVADLLAHGGTALVELSGTRPGVEQHTLHLRVGGRRTRSFTWATVGAEAIEELAASAALVVSELRTVSQRQVATLRHRPGIVTS